MGGYSVATCRQFSQAKVSLAAISFYLSLVNLMHLVVVEVDIPFGSVYGVFFSVKIFKKVVLDVFFNYSCLLLFSCCLWTTGSCVKWKKSWNKLSMLNKLNYFIKTIMIIIYCNEYIQLLPSGDVSSYKKMCKLVLGKSSSFFFQSEWWSVIFN